MKARVSGAEDGAQLTLSFAAPTIIPNGSGGFIVTPGKPLIEYTPEQFGKAVGICRRAVYNRIQDGTIKGVRRPSPRKYLIDAAEVIRFREWTRNLECWDKIQN